MKINEAVITQVKADVEGLFRSYQSNINEAYLAHGDKFSVTFKALLEPAKSGDGISIETEISFRPEPDIKEKTIKKIVNASQQVLEFVPDKRV